MEFNNKHVRRQDRLLDEVRSFEILRNGEYGILSMVSEDGNGAYGIPLSYVWDRGNSIYIHCAPVGRKLNCIDANQSVSFCVVGRTKVQPDKFTTGYESIVLKCTAHHSLHEAERMSALSLFISKYCPSEKIRGMEYANKSFHRTEIIRLDIEEISGKCKNMF
ncbi:MAG: pyridoxamine 5'-phosphate oxidase family protein [Phocaeicola sp.]|mgnify:FL=1|nr:pyridoxamine 5'-phosphate oxidase family protein [Phocaeicola sp.]